MSVKQIIFSILMFILFGVPLTVIFWSLAFEHLVSLVFGLSIFVM